jgi:hypothetical protein
MPCYISCALATIFVIASIFMTNMTQKNKTIQQYQSQLPSKLQNIYMKITPAHILLWLRIRSHIVHNYYSLQDPETIANDKRNNGLYCNHGQFHYKLFLLFIKSKINLYVRTYKLTRANKSMAYNV